MRFSTDPPSVLRMLGLRHAFGDGYSDRRPGLPMSGCSGRLLIGLLIAGFALFQYFSHPSETNSFTGREQKLDLSPQEEIQLGLASRSEMANTYGGLSRDAQGAARVKRVGQKLVTGTDAHETEYQFDFHLLADTNTV